MENPLIKKCPLWAVIGLLGGLLAFLGMFMNVFAIDQNIGMGPGGDATLEFGWSAIKILTFGATPVIAFTWYKVLPLIVAILGLSLILYSIHSIMSAGSDKPSKMPAIIVGITSAVMLILIIVFIVICYNGSILENTEGLDSFHPCAGSWFMLLGSVLGIVSAVLSKLKNEL